MGAEQHYGDPGRRWGVEEDPTPHLRRQPRDEAALAREIAATIRSEQQVAPRYFLPPDRGGPGTRRPARRCTPPSQRSRRPTRTLPAWRPPSTPGRRRRPASCPAPPD